MTREPAAPRSLAELGELARRRALLGAPHLATMRPLIDAMREHHGDVPDPDPLDGGAQARLLLLLETPGPSIRGTGLVSRDNPTGTAANLLRFLAEAGLPRKDTLIWNAVPFVIHAPGALNRAPNRGEIAAGRGWLAPLLAVLPRLRVVVLAGRIAGQSEHVIAAARPDVAILAMPHPSPTYVCTSPDVRARIADAMNDAARHLARAAGRAA